MKLSIVLIAVALLFQYNVVVESACTTGAFNHIVTKNHPPEETTTPPPTQPPTPPPTTIPTTTACETTTAEMWQMGK